MPSKHAEVKIFVVQPDGTVLSATTFPIDEYVLRNVDGRTWTLTLKVVPKERRGD